jgi:hypothetical protein
MTIPMCTKCQPHVSTVLSLAKPRGQKKGWAPVPPWTEKYLSLQASVPTSLVLEPVHYSLWYQSIPATHSYTAVKIHAFASHAQIYFLYSFSIIACTIRPEIHVQAYTLFFRRTVCQKSNRVHFDFRLSPYNEY